MGEVLVTGAGGGAGSVAVLLLAALGYHVVASTGRPNLEPRLRDLRAAAVIDRRLMLDEPPKLLEKDRFAAAIDAVGPKTIPAVIPQLRYDGVIAACGLAGGSGDIDERDSVLASRRFLAGH